MSQKIQGLYAIADNTFRRDLTPAELALNFLRGGAGIVQLRMKSGTTDYGLRTTDQGSGRERGLGRDYGPGTRDQGLKIMALKKKYDFTFIVNDHVDVAVEVGADGVRVGADDMPIAEVREKVGSKMIIGYSSHSLEEAVAAEKAGADYVAFGAIFPTKTKGPGHPVQSLEKLRAVVQELKVPVVAIGGINKENFQNVLETGVAAIAMITALTGADDIAQETQFFDFNYRTIVPSY